MMGNRYWSRLRYNIDNGIPYAEIHECCTHALIEYETKGLWCMIVEITTGKERRRKWR